MRQRGNPVSSTIVRMMVAFSLVVLGMGVMPAANAAVPQSAVGITKTNDLAGAALQPGQEFKYTLTAQCSGLTVDCVNFTVTDTLPVEFDVTSLPQSTSTRTVSYDSATRLLTIVFKQDLQEPAGAFGLGAGGTVNLEIGMRLPAGTSVKDGAKVTNTAHVAADNADPMDSSNDVTVSIPRVVAPVATKGWTDGSAVAGTGEESTITLGIRNGSSSSATVTELKVTDQTPATFETFDFTGAVLTAFPLGADTAVLRVKTAAGWVAGPPSTSAGSLALPAGVDAGDATGVEVVFTNAAGTPLPYDATGGTVELGMKLRGTSRSTGAELSPAAKLTVNNCATPAAVDATVGAITGADACKSYDILPSTLNMAATKGFFPDTNGNFAQDSGEYAVLGEHSPVTAAINVTNNSAFPIKTITITEPGAGAVSEFDKLDASNVRVRFPQGATAADLTVSYADGTTLTKSYNANAVEDIAKAGTSVTKIEVTYTGTDAGGNASIAIGATAGLDVHGTLNDKVTSADLPGGTSPGVDNCAGFTASAGRVDGTGTAAGTACKTLAIQLPNSSTTGVKNVGQTSVPAGQPIPFTLQMSNNGNKPLVTPVISDPRTGADGKPDTNFANPFDTLKLTAASVSVAPAVPGANIEVFDPDSQAWTAYNANDAALLERARGVRATVNGNLVPLGKLTLSLVTQRRPGTPDNVAILNCFSTNAAGDYVPGAPACSPQIETGPVNDSASLNKSINPGTLPEYVPGLPQQFADVNLSISNDGNMSAKMLQATDNEAGFFDAVDFVKIKSSTMPVGANRVQIDAFVGGAWVMGTPKASASLPAGVAANTVRGIRATYSSTNSANGGYVLTPCAADGCRGLLTFQVTPRLTLLSDPSKEVPKNLLNTVTGKFLTQIQDPGTPKDIAPNDAALVLTKGTPQLSVDKSPNSVIGPGETAPFYLKVTNTGTAMIPDLVVKDLLPAGMTFDETFKGDGGAPFKVKDTQVPAGTPAVPAPVFSTRIAGDKVDQTTWDFSKQADGSAWLFAPGSTLTIEIQVTLAPGVSASDVITNTMGATSTDPNLTCGGTSQTNGGFGAGLYCTDPASLTVKAGAAFQARKWVAGNPALGWYNGRTKAPVAIDGPGCPVATDAAGVKYTAYPCIALVNPGDSYNYMLRLVNSGTEPGTDMRIIDRFPAPGDKGVIINQDRGTEWNNRPVLVSEPVLTGPGALTTSYTNSSAICTKDLAMGGAGSNAPQCAASDWSDPFSTSVTAAQMRVAFNPAIVPGAKVDITFSMKTPLDVAAASDPTVAWNSYAHAETTARDGKTNVLPPTEPIQVGVALAYGSLSLQKAIGANPSNLPLDTVKFTFHAKCTISPVGGPATTVLDKDFKVSAAVPINVPGIPAGAGCDVWEVDSLGGFTDHDAAHPVSLVITGGLGAPSIQAVKITNDFPDAVIELNKTVTGDGAAFAQDAFPMDVFCTFAGAPVPGYSPLKVTVRPLEGRYVTNVPPGSQCQVVETDDGGATEVTYTPAGTPGASGSVTTAAGVPHHVSVTNDFRTSTLVVNKEVVGAGSPQHAQGPFTYSVVCSFNGRPGVVNKTITIAKGNGSQTAFTSEPLDGLPVGAECTVAETDNGGADATPSPVTVTILDGRPVVAGFTRDGENPNVYSAGTIGLAKELAGDAKDEDYAKNAVFTIHVSCERDARDAEGNPVRTTVLSKDVQIKGGETIAALKDKDGNPITLPVGTHCYGGETVTGGATSSAIDKDSFDNAAVVEVQENPEELQKLSITAVNTFDYAPLVLNKKVDGGAAGYVGNREFTVALTCVLPQGGEEPTALVTAREYKITGGQSITVEKLPVGALCWTEETDRGGADSTIIDHGSLADAAVVGGKETAGITATNTFDAAVLTVSKRVVNGGAGPYSLTLMCTTSQGPVPLDAADAAFSLKGGESRTVSVPLGAECAVAEVDVPDGDTVTFADSDGGTDGKLAVNGTVSVTVTNTFQVAPVAPEDLSSTGANNVALLAGGGAGALAAGALVLWLMRRNRTRS